MRSTRLSTIVMALWALGTISLAGCSSSSSADDLSANEPERPARTGAYPDFSAPLDSAMAQMTDQEAADQEAELSSLARQRQTGAISAAEYQRRVAALRLLKQQAQE